MFDALAFIFENYVTAEECADRNALRFKLNAYGFEEEETEEAIAWLDELEQLCAALPRDKPPAATPPPHTTRIYSHAEHAQLGGQALDYFRFLEREGALSAAEREIVIDRLMALGPRINSHEDFKLVILMVLWVLGREPDGLIVDELLEIPDDEEADGIAPGELH